MGAKTDQEMIQGLPESPKATRIRGALSTLQPAKLLDFYTVCPVGSRADPAPKKEPKLVHTAVQRSTSPRRILIADDEPHIRRILQTVLETAGFEVDLRHDGTDALQAIHGTEHYDLILLDIMMPGATGLEVLGKIRAMEGRKSTPVVILTAKGQDADRQAAFSLGADDFLTKPFSPKKLLARIHQIIDGD